METFYLIRIYFARFYAVRTDASYYIPVSSFAKGCKHDIFKFLLVPTTQPTLGVVFELIWFQKHGIFSMVSNKG